ncbi:SOUL family heme-binding protein [Brevundimonas sp. R86498]|uniref:SOUL family heme-binding protein n=1 Tax=Brevundimonas sp. R86498 TaxID=3093845 RepID=UPI0037CB758F
MKSAVLGLGAAILTTACSTVGVRTGTEEPAWREIARVGEIEVRTYEPRIAARTVVTGDSDAARNAGFRKLAGYIFGANSGRTSIAMTAPVAQAPSQTIAMTAPVAQAPSGTDLWAIEFFMPAEWTLETLPVPRDPAVQLVEVPAETFAVLRFSGVGSTRAVDSRKATLLAGLTDSGWRTVGEPVAWFYDPPWSVPALRRNEVAVRVEPR